MSKPYRIFHLIKGLGRGGAEKLLSEGLKHADRENFRYGYGYFLPWKDALTQELRAMGADVTCFSATNSAGVILSGARVAKYLRNWKADLIHCHLPLSGIAGRIAGKFTALPVVYTEHNLQTRYHPWTRRMNIWTWRFQNAVVAVSNEVAASIHSHTSSHLPVHVILNGVSVDDFKPSSTDRNEIRRSFDIPPNAPLVGNVAGFRSTKNLSDWLKTARLILDRFPDCHFLLVGDGPLRSSLEQEAASLNLSSRVHFAGIQENVKPFYSAMDVFVSSSVFEGLPLALLEAMSAELPVVMTSAGGVKEVVRNGESGILIDEKSPALLSEKVVLLLSDPGLRRKFGIAARSTIEQKFSIRRMVRDLEQLYREILEKQALQQHKMIEL